MPLPKLKHSIQTFWKACQLWWQDWSNMVTLSLLVILLTLTVMLAPIAYFGLLQVTTDLSHGLRTGLAGFWAAFKQYWKPALVWGLLSLGLLGPLGFGFWYFAIKPASLPVPVAISAIMTGFKGLNSLTRRFRQMRSVPNDKRVLVRS